MDLRSMAQMTGCQPGGLGKMSQQYLNSQSYKENPRIHHLWEQEDLSKEQIDYAAKDAFHGIELFKFFARKLQGQPINVERIIDQFCDEYLDKRYIDKPPNKWDKILLGP